MEATLCFSANLASPVGFCVSLIYSFLPNFFCISELSGNSHQGVAACTSLVLCYRAHVFTCGSPLFLSVSFRSLRFGASNVFVLLRDCFVWLVQTFGFGCFLRRVFFFFCVSFTYLELFYLRYFSFSVFLSTFLHLRYRNVFHCMRFSQLIHLML